MKRVEKETTEIQMRVTVISEDDGSNGNLQSIHVSIQYATTDKGLEEEIICSHSTDSVTHRSTNSNAEEFETLEELLTPKKSVDTLGLLDHSEVVEFIVKGELESPPVAFTTELVNVMTISKAEEDSDGMANLVVEKE